MIGSLAPRVALPPRTPPTPPQPEAVPSHAVSAEPGTRPSPRADRVEPSASAEGPRGESLSPDEQREVERLKARDAEVRAHEQAHAAVGGPYAGSPSYTYEQGPDGRRYAVEGEVPIDTSEIPDDPEASIQKLEVVVRAALAPAQPSSQDRKVASEAQAKIARLRAEMVQDDQPEEGASPPARGLEAYGRAGSEPPPSSIALVA